MIAIYPGSFNPFHDGHKDVLLKTHCLFDKIILAIGSNPDKPITEVSLTQLKDKVKDFTNVEIVVFKGFLVDFVKKSNVDIIIRGLRNSADFEYEKSQQYWNEDLGLFVPTLYIISDRKLTHISSSAIRMINKIKGV